MADDDKITGFHYTTQEAAKAIEESGVIKQSSNGLGGPGVYVTTMPPSNSDGAILLNNYDSNFQKESDPKNVECYVEVSMGKNEVDQVPGAGGRDVLIHKGDINLSERDCKIVCKKQ